MGYFKNIKNHLDNNNVQLIVVGTGVVIFDNQDRILLGKRVDNGLWCTPGGTLEPGETLERCAVREVEEETGIRIEIDELRQNYTYAVPDKVVKDGMEIYVVSVSYTVKLDIGTEDIRMDKNEYSSLGFYTTEEVIGMLAQMTEYTKAEIQHALNIRM